MERTVEAPNGAISVSRKRDRYSSGKAILDDALAEAEKKAAEKGARVDKAAGYGVSLKRGYVRLTFPLQAK